MQLKGKNNLLSILLPFKNEEAYLHDCIESIQNQVNPNWELIAVDDHSNDSSAKIATEFERNDPRIRLIKNDGKGLVAALSTAFNNSTGNLISRMDADDLCTADKYQSMMEAWQGRGTVAVGQVKYFSDDNLLDGFKRYEQWLNRVMMHPEPWQFIYQECVVPSPSWLLHRQDLIDIGGITDGTYPEDYELAFRMYKAQFELVPTQKAVHLWRDHGRRNSRTNPLYANHFFPEIKAKYFSEIELGPAGRAVVWGAGKRGKALVRDLVALGCNPLWYTNNPKKVGHDIYGIILRAEDSYLPRPEDRIALVISSEEEREEVITKLDAIGLRRGVNYWFFC